MMAVDFDAIRREHPLAKIVGESVKLKKSGAHLIGACPFHADRSPSFVLFGEGYHCFGCSAHGDVIDFVAATEHLSIGESIRFLTGGSTPSLTAEDREQRRRDEARREKERLQAQAAARAEAARRWDAALPINGAGAGYLTRKNVAPYGCRREDECLLVPIFDNDGRIMSVQSIPPEAGGRKMFQVGAVVKGGRFLIGPASDGPVIVVEGFATGATVQAATGEQVAISFAKNNLLAVAEGLRAESPDRVIIIGADTNGVPAAEAAARAVAGHVIVPDLQGAEGTDFNDQAGHYGLEDVAALFRAPAAPLKPETALPLIWFDDNHALLQGNWIIKNMVPAEAFMTIIGHPGCGKSFLALDLALHIAAGMQWQDRKTKKGLVLYLAAEGQRGQQNRVEAWKRHYAAAGLAFAMIPVAINLRDHEADLPKLYDTIRAALAYIGVDLSVLVVDTLNRTFGGGDENGSDMSEYVDNVGRIKAEFGCTTIVVHHIPKTSENGTITERGHGSLRGAIETSLVVSHDVESGLRTMRCTKMKDAEDGWALQFRLQVVELGVDEDGDPVTSCVVAPAEQPSTELAEVKGRTSGPKMSPTQRQAYNELLATLQAHRVGIPPDFPEEHRGTMRDGLVTSKKVYQERWTAIAASDLSAASASATFRRAVMDLRNGGLAASWNDFIWALN